MFVVTIVVTVVAGVVVFAVIFFLLHKIEIQILVSRRVHGLSM